jgi:NSS family neurotransmitter:Na+ symporter
MTEEASPRPQWKTSSGFILATLGSAIGLGNIWRFSYVVGDNGGGAFLLIYLVTIIIVGLPMLLAELAIGRMTRREAASAFSQLGKTGPWRRAGILGVIVSFIILTYYGVITGWAARYFVALTAGLHPSQPEAAADYFHVLIAAPIEPVLWQAIVMAITIVIVVGGVAGGIERASKILMPALGVLVIALALHSLTLPGASRGLLFLFAPDWDVFSRPRVYLAALGQAFFSLDLAMGVLVTYGSYVQSLQRLPAAGVTIALGDTLFAIVAAIIIFPAIFSFGMSPDQGPGLAFIALPEIFIRMTGGHAVGIAFFGLLFLAAITSLMALLEVPVAFAIERWRLGRAQATLFVGVTAFLLGVPSSLGFGLLSNVRLAGLPILDAVDFLASNLLLPFSGFAIALFIGWHWQQACAIEAVGFRRTWIAHLWYVSIRYAVPTMITMIFLRSISIL